MRDPEYEIINNVEDSLSGSDCGEGEQGYHGADSSSLPARQSSKIDQLHRPLVRRFLLMKSKAKSQYEQYKRVKIASASALPTMHWAKPRWLRMTSMSTMFRRWSTSRPQRRRQRAHRTYSIADGEVVGEVDDTYLVASKFTKFFRGTLFQMILFGSLSFVGPAMSDAISNLGGGGLSKPYLANLANSVGYASGCLMTLFGGPLINKIGIKYSCLIAALTFPLDGSAYYVSAKYGIDWYLLFSKILGGFTSGFLYVAETAAMLSYPDPNSRGLYLGIWSAMRNSGSIIGGAINFSTNYSNSDAGGIAWSTYLIFVGFECTGIFFALLLSPTRRVRRPNGVKIPMSPNASWKKEFQALWSHAQKKKTWLVFIPAFHSFFYGGTMGTYLSLHFSVRARAMSSLITPTIVIPMVMAYGKCLDMKRWSQPRRAWVAFSLWVIPQVACFIWIGIEYSRFGSDSYSLDYKLNPSRWAEAYLPYLIIFTTGYLCQLSLYWILGTFSTDLKHSSRTGGLFRAFETAGQAVSYGINSSSGDDPRIGFYVNCALLALVIPAMVALVRMIPETPATVDIDGGEVEEEVVVVGKGIERVEARDM